MVSENDSNKKHSIYLGPPPNLGLLFNQFNNTSPSQIVDQENVVNSRYFDIDEIQALKLHDKTSLYLFSISMHAHCIKTLMIWSIHKQILIHKQIF